MIERRAALRGPVAACADALNEVSIPKSDAILRVIRGRAAAARAGGTANGGGGGGTRPTGAAGRGRSAGRARSGPDEVRARRFWLRSLVSTSSRIWVREISMLIPARRAAGSYTGRRGHAQRRGERLPDIPSCHHYAQARGLRRWCTAGARRPRRWRRALWPRPTATRRRPRICSIATRASSTGRPCRSRCRRSGSIWCRCGPNSGARPRPPGCTIRPS